MNAPCGEFRASTIVSSRCGVCGWPEHAHQLGGDQVKTPAEIGQRLSDTFDPGGAIDYDIDTWATDHATAIDEARSLLEAPLNRDISAAVEDALRTLPGSLTPGEWCDLLAHQVEQLRELEGAAEDVDQPDRQAHHRLVTIAGMATAFAEQLDRHLAKNPPTAPKKGKKR